MLSRISIQNYALIDKLEIQLPGGLTVITGETGAGKSILLGALGLIAGQRADSGVLQDKNRKCSVEVSFSLDGVKLESFFERNNLDYEKETTVRREINPEGKSRAFINDTPVNLNVLKEFGAKLIDIHSQHETLVLNDSEFQLSVLDVVARTEKLLSAYSADYKRYRSLELRLRELQEAEAASLRDLDYFRFQFKELEEAGLNKIDQEKLESELEVLENSEEIKSQLGKAVTGLNGGELNVLTSLAEIKNLTSHLSKYNPAIASLAERLQSSYIELKDIADEMEALEGEIVYNPERVEELNTILDTLYRMLQKHQVKSVKELIDIREEIAKRLEGISTLETEISAVQKELAIMRKDLMNKAGVLSENRHAAVPKVEKEILKLLRQLGMPDALLKVSCTSLPDGMFDETGTDKVNFLFSANKGAEPKELSKVASGGELSRLMLSIKSLVASHTTLRTAIFDEIDTGVSGDVADKVGSIMEQMSASMQVIAITHLPQIASKGNSHLFVYKEIKEGKTYSRIKALDKADRIQEIAKMLSTGTPTPAALKNAKELLNA